MSDREFANAVSKSPSVDLLMPSKFPSVYVRGFKSHPLLHSKQYYDDQLKCVVVSACWTAQAKPHTFIAAFPGFSAPVIDLHIMIKLS
jgi:hypothetical protein